MVSSSSDQVSSGQSSVERSSETACRWSSALKTVWRIGTPSASQKVARKIMGDSYSRRLDRVETALIGELGLRWGSDATRRAAARFLAMLDAAGPAVPKSRTAARRAAAGPA